VPSASAIALLAGIAMLPRLRRSPKARRRRVLPFLPIRAALRLCEGIREAQALLRAGGGKLIGPVAYYAFDNAVLWAAFRALGHSPPLGVLVVAYVIGQAGSLLPVPGGLGRVEATLIGTLVVYGIALAPAAAAVLVYRAVSLSVPLALGVAAYIRPRRPLVLPSLVSGRLHAPERPGSAN
jgi:Lysylphosphatidylglycerol synthase TM region